MVELHWVSKPKNIPYSKHPICTHSWIHPALSEQDQVYSITPEKKIQPSKILEPAWYTPFHSTLIQGDNLSALQALEKGKVRFQLIYIDPPFESNEDYHFHHGIQHNSTSQTQSLKQIAYTDTWSQGLTDYLDMLYPRLEWMHRLLAPTGYLVVHSDWHSCHYCKILLDEMFGRENFINEIIWRSTSSHNNAKRCGNIHQVLYLYAKEEKKRYWNTSYRVPYDENYINHYFSYIDENGRRFKSEDLTVPSRTPANYFAWMGKYPSKKRGWKYTKEGLDTLYQEGFIFFTKNKFPRYKRYLDETNGMPPQSLWIDKQVWNVGSWSNEQVGFETQKPISLLERIISLTTQPGDWVADFFAGSGSFAVAAERLDRSWILVDQNPISIALARSRLHKETTQGFVLAETMSGALELPSFCSQKTDSSFPTKPTSFKPVILDFCIQLKQKIDFKHTMDIHLLFEWKGYSPVSNLHSQSSTSLPWQEYILYWAVDTAWDGQFFTSHWETHRRYGKQEQPCPIHAELIITWEREPQSSEKTWIAVQLMDIYGDKSFVLIKLDIEDLE